MGEVIRGPWPDRPRGSENHPAGRHPNDAASRAAARAEFPMKWRSVHPHPSTVEERRADVLNRKPRCTSCGVMFTTKWAPPKDGLCRSCRAEKARDHADKDQGELF